MVGLCGDLDLRGVKGEAAVHVDPEPGPFGHPVGGALFSREDAGYLAQLVLITLQVAGTLGLQQTQLFLPTLVHGDFFAHVRVEAVVGVGREEGVQHCVNLWGRKSRDLSDTMLEQTQCFSDRKIAPKCENNILLGLFGECRRVLSKQTQNCPSDLLVTVVFM